MSHPHASPVVAFVQRQRRQILFRLLILGLVLVHGFVLAGSVGAVPVFTATKTDALIGDDGDN